MIVNYCNEISHYTQSESDLHWMERAYPLQQIEIRLQGTRHSERKWTIEQLETVLTRLRAGDTYDTELATLTIDVFSVVEASGGPSFFKESAGVE